MIADLIAFCHDQPAVFVAFAAILGLIVGSFLNVVIYRLPLIMERQWREQLEHDARPGEPFNLARPGSRCPRCGHAITPLENIPVVSFLALRGRCSACGEPISRRYPAIEALSAVLTALVAWHFGFGVQAAAAMLLTWVLIALSFIDIDHQLLPDVMTLPFLWVGLGLSLFEVFTDAEAAIIGAMGGYLILWGVYRTFKLVTGKEGMGFGDFKLLALLGAWLGWHMLPLIILLSSFAGAAIGVVMIILQGRDKNVPIPFGPYLAIAGWIAMLWGHEIVSGYLSLAGRA